MLFSMVGFEDTHELYESALIQQLQLFSSLTQSPVHLK